MTHHRSAFTVLTDRPRESTFQRLVRHNFWLSILALVAMVVWSYVVLSRTGEQVAPMALSSPADPLHDQNAGGWAYVLMELVAGWCFYRKGGVEARGAAAFVGLFLIAALLVVVGSAAPGTNPALLPVLVILYASGSHLLYAAAGSSAWRGG